MTGKTTLVTRLLQNPKFRLERPCIILDPNLDERWPHDEGVFLSHNKELFLQAVKHPDNYGSIVVVDESGESIGRNGGDMAWLATRGRHYGHQCIFIAQRAMQVDVNVRTQCANMFIFRQGDSDAKILAAEKASNEIKQAPDLQKGEYLAVVGLNPVVKKKLF